MAACGDILLLERRLPEKTEKLFGGDECVACDTRQKELSFGHHKIMFLTA